MKREIIEGKTFGSWFVLSYAGCFDDKKSYYRCMCKKCGRVFTVRGDKMKSGTSTQCKSCAKK